MKTYYANTLKRDLISRYDDLIKELQRMDKSKYSFRLTGSRFFGGVHVGSDWDFFVGDVIGVREFLEENGYGGSKEFAKMYPDGNTSEVVEKVVIAGDRKTQIHIQIVKDFRLKCAAQQKLKEWGQMPLVPKDARSWLWRLAFDIIKTGEDIYA